MTDAEPLLPTHAAPSGTSVLSRIAYSVLPLPEKRGLSRVEAAAYIGVSPSLFDEMVDDRRMPNPKSANARKLWDRRKLDRAFDALDDDGEAARDPWGCVAV